MTDTDRRWTQEERLASLKHRLASETAPRPFPLADLSDAALGRYWDQWRGTTRGDAAAEEIAHRAQGGPVFAGPVRSHGLYSVTVEYTGNGATIPGLRAGQRYVARFAGEYVGGADAEELAWVLCNAHRRGRDVALSGR